MENRSRDAANADQTTSSGSDQNFLVQPPAVALPKGGGAVHGIGEKFGANPVTGTGSLSVPIYTSPGRSGFGPQLSVSYDSGSGNGPFGLGWGLSLPSITRKTDKGLPRYRDRDESDVFIIAGAEDLVPWLSRTTAGSWERESRTRTANDASYRVDRYRPRVESGFALIERWTHERTRETQWRTVSRDNVTSIFGADDSSRIADAADKLRVFSWLISRTFDDRGNVVVFRYTPEDYLEVDVASAHERNRDHAMAGPQRYLDRILYGNATPYQPSFAAPQATPLPATWMFEVAFDYGGHDDDAPAPIAAGRWKPRPDPFSTYRAGFEIRTHRLCRRVLMYHRFAELGATPCLVRSTEFRYEEAGTTSDPLSPSFSLLQSAWQRGYERDATAPGGYRWRLTPPVEFTYSRARIADEIRGIDPADLENLPVGVTGPGYQLVDLEGEGLSGVLSEQGGSWFYKPNLGEARFGPTTMVARKPSSAALNAGRQQLMDLDGDGRLELVDFGGPTPGLQERTDDEGWTRFVPFESLPNLDWKDANLRFIDISGDGRADALVTEDEVFTWFPSLGEAGFAPGERTRQPRDEELGPHLVFADATQSIFIADMAGDGLQDLVRIRNGEVCYWPNMGYGRFGARVVLDDAPWFDSAEFYDPRRVRLADVDGSGPADIIYLGRDGARLYVNRSGNALSRARALPFPVATDDLAAVRVADLLGNGTACLIWSSALPGDTRRPARFLDLMGGQKPHLLVGVNNNLGATTVIDYLPSTRFYLADRKAGRPWATKLPFPVHCVAKVAVTDKWRGATFSSTYSYHHGHFDGVEREFRGFGRVEQLDVEDYGVFAAGNVDSPYITSDRRLYQPPVKTVTWFHTGAAERRELLGRYRGEYFPASVAALPIAVSISPGFAEKQLVEPDPPSPDLTDDEWREAARACKGIPLRQEMYELDVEALRGSAGKPPAQIPVRLFSVKTHSCRIRRLQNRETNRHAVFLVLEDEALSYEYELDLRKAVTPAAGAAAEPLEPDPRVAHTLTLSFDDFGNAQQSIAVSYRRARPSADATLAAQQTLIRDVQSEQHVAYMETRYTADAIDRPTGTLPIGYYRLPLRCEVQTYELTGIRQRTGRFYFDLDDLREWELSARYPTAVATRPVVSNPYHELPQTAAATKRLVEHSRTLFFQDDAAAAGDFLTSPLDLGGLGRLGLIYEQYRLAFTDGLLDVVYTPARLSQPLGGGATVRSALRDPPRSGYASGTRFYPTMTPPAAAAAEYWIRSGVAGFAPDAAQHFYLPDRYTDPFGNETLLTHDQRNLFVQASTDATGNTTSVLRFDYRVLGPALVEDTNDNRAEARFDALGNLVAVALEGKGGEADDLAGYTGALANPTPGDVAAVFRDAPDETTVRRLLGNATTRHAYHFGETVSAAGVPTWATRPAGSCQIAREEHARDVARRRQADPTAVTALQLSFECSDALGNVLMKRIQAERDATGGPARWVVSGKTILNNKGKPVKQYEPYFSQKASCSAEGDVQEAVGVTALMYYDAVGRLMRTEMPDGTLSRAEFSPWQVTTFDANDTVGESAWYASRTPPSPALPLPRDPMTGALLASPDERAAWLSAQHDGTPAFMILDSLGRPVVAIVHNRVEDAGGTLRFGGKRYRDERYVTYTKLDAEGKPLWIRDARGNLVMQYLTRLKRARWADEPHERVPANSAPSYDVAGNLLYQHSMDSGDRWTINDAANKALFAWDSRDHLLISSYDELHRPTTVELVTAGQSSGIHVGLTQYSARTADDRTYNRRGKPWRVFDQSGVITNVEFDFKGNAVRSTRRLARDYDTDTDWRGVLGTPLTAEPGAQLMSETFNQVNTFDALNRMTRHYSWYRVGEPVAVYESTYNQRGLLLSQALTVDATKTPDGHTGGTRTVAIASITYDAKGQRLRMRLGNGVVTRYGYDPATFRLVSLRSNRANGSTLQDRSYTYDPIGNITEISDAAVPTEFFDNSVIESRKRYSYDSLYRLTEATGREHAGQNNIAPAENWVDCPFRVSYAANDAKAWRTFTQTYTYDGVGNILRMRHVTPAATAQGWTRQYEYALDSNRLLASATGAAPVTTHYPAGVPTLANVYSYNQHGSMARLAHLPQMDWDFTEHLGYISRAAATVSADPDGCPDSSLEAWYRYDSAKQRIRKRVVKSGSTVEERFYLGGVEWYRRSVGGVLREEIETLHLIDGQQRVLMVDQVRDSAQGRSTLYRYALSDHLGSSAVEVDENADVISFEEYHPYGTTAYQSGPNAVDVKRKRYRFTGMERDEESGLAFHHMRYLNLTLARWISADPIGIAGGMNLFAAVSGNPLGRTDKSGTADGKETGEQRVEREMLTVYPAGKTSLRFSIIVTDPATGRRFRQIIDAAIGAANEFMDSNTFVEHKGDAKANGDPSTITEGQSIFFGLVRRPGGVTVEVESRFSRLFNLMKGKPLHLEENQNFLFVDTKNLAAVKEGTGVAFGTGGYRVAQPPSIRRGGGVVGFTLGAIIVGVFLAPLSAEAASSTVQSQKAKEGVSEVVGTLVQGGIDWVQQVGPQNALAGATVVMTAARLKATAGLRAGTAALRAGASTLQSTGSTLLRSGASAARTAGSALLRTGTAAARTVASAAGSAWSVLTAEVAAGTAATAAVTGAAILAAVGSVALAGETIHAAATGQETPIDVADKFYGTHFGHISGWLRGEYSH